MCRCVFFFSSRRRHTRLQGDWSSDVCSSDLFDPYNLVNSAMTAAFAQAGNQTPKYGEGGVAYGKRFGAAVADGASQCLLGAAVFSSLLHQDPRYFRMGPRRVG